MTLIVFSAILTEHLEDNQGEKRDRKVKTERFNIPFVSKVLVYVVFCLNIILTLLCKPYGHSGFTLLQIINVLKFYLL